MGEIQLGGLRRKSYEKLLEIHSRPSSAETNTLVRQLPRDEGETDERGLKSGQ